MDWNDCRANQAPGLMRILDISARCLPEMRHAAINQNMMLFGVLEAERNSPIIIFTGEGLIRSRVLIGLAALKANPRLCGATCWSVCICVGAGGC